jgi:hypothetical protein
MDCEIFLRFAWIARSRKSIRPFRQDFTWLGASSPGSGKDFDCANGLLVSQRRLRRADDALLQFLVPIRMQSLYLLSALSALPSGQAAASLYPGAVRSSFRCAGGRAESDADTIKNSPPNCPPTSIFLVLKLN